MLETGRYVYVLFMCQQTLEKLLKAHVVRTTKEFPPRLHNLLRLLEITKLEATEEDRKFLEKLNYYYLESRYPEEKRRISKEAKRSLAEEYLKKTEEAVKWLKEKLG
jgi:HEPN domain-containing protein